MTKIIVLWLAFLLMASDTTSAATATANLDIVVTGPSLAADVPGPSAALFNSPYYTCVRNFYVATNGNNSNSGTSPASPWLTIANADSASRQGGDCINVAPGTYGAFDSGVAHGGSSATSNGYVVYRCSTPNFISGGGCIIAPAGEQLSVCTGANCGGVSANYVMVDGFVFQGNPSTTTGSSFAWGVSCGNSGTTACAHHWWVINSTMSNYGQGGVQTQDAEYLYVVHNKIFHTAIKGCATPWQGSGISINVPKPVAGYTPTADDTNANNKTTLNSMGVQGPSFPFKIVTAWNVTYNNNIGCTGASSVSDGNGIIMDTWATRNGNTINYAGRGLVAFNVTYNNGGGGIVVFQSDHITIANNTCYNNWLNPYDQGTARFCIALNLSNDSVVINNIAVGVPVAGACSYNPATPYLKWNGSMWGRLSSGGAISTFANNVTDTQGTGIACNGEITVDSPVVYNSPPNSVRGTDPLWVNVGNTSTGDQNTPPVGANFALTVASPAIGFGQTQPWLPPQSVDAGACHHTLASCP